MEYVKLQEYIKNRQKPQPNQDEPIFWRGNAQPPELQYFTVKCCNHKATVIYYVECVIHGDKSKFIYHYTILYECNYYVTNQYIADDNPTPFKQYITELIECTLAINFARYTTANIESIKIFNNEMK